MRRLALVAGEILRARLAEKFAAALQFRVDPLEHAEREFAVALDGDDPGMRQVFGGITFELHAFLEIDEIELDLLRAAPQRQIGDDDMEQRGLAGAGFAGDKHVLAGAFANRQHLEFLGPGAADGHAHFVVVSDCQSSSVGGVICENGTCDPVRVDAGLADAVDQRDRVLERRRRIEYHKIRPGRRVCQMEPAVAQGHAQCRCGAVPLPARRPAAGWRRSRWTSNARRSGRRWWRWRAGRLHGGFAEGGGKPGNHQETVFLRDAAGLFVVFRDVRELVAQVHLDDLLDVLVEFGQTFLDLAALRPDAVVMRDSS